MSLARTVDIDAVPPDIGSEAAPITGAETRTRLNSIDLLRGLVMIIMALDHTRDYFGGTGLNPNNVADPALFLTRWITHFCAPTFIFLAGTSAYLYGMRVGRTVGEVSRFLLTRGLWLLVVEFAIMTFGWTFNPTWSFLIGNVIWAIAASMIVLAGLVWLPRWAIVLFGLALIGGHDLFDGVKAADLGSFSWLWIILHQGGNIPIPGVTVFHVLYPLVPWVGVMAVGYALGTVYQWEAGTRRLTLAGLGVIVIFGFVALRASNLYGDPDPWTAYDTTLPTVLSFVNTHKYPPSLLFLMMTLGPALVLLAAFEGVSGRLPRFVTAYGRAPLIYYVAHIYVLHAAMMLFVLAASTDPSWIFRMPPKKPADYGATLPVLYAIWVGVVLLLYPLVRWFAAVKQRRREWWLSYL